MGAETPNFAPTDIMACCAKGSCGFGCEGGFLYDSWKYVMQSGIVTGSPYRDTSGCMKYPFAPCGHRAGPEEDRCDRQPSPELDQCTSQCDTDSTSPNPFNDDKHFFGPAYAVQGEAGIMFEVMTHGPVAASFNVFEDFFSYAGGVYSWKTGRYVGGHAVRIVGWGVDEDSGLKYWTIANSWGEGWGEQGHFRMLRGVNHLAVENTPNAAKPLV